MSGWDQVDPNRNDFAFRSLSNTLQLSDPGTVSDISMLGRAVLTEEANRRWRSVGITE